MSWGGMHVAQVKYLNAQRWGSAVAAPVNLGGRNAMGAGTNTRTVAGVQYDSSASLALAPPSYLSDEADATGAL
jgi:hypothetical protein